MLVLPTLYDFAAFEYRTGQNGSISVKLKKKSKRDTVAYPLSPRIITFNKVLGF